MNKYVWAIIILVVIVMGYYLIFPAFTNIEVNEESPLVDNLDSMDAETKAEFDRQVAEAQSNILEMDDSMSGGVELLSEGIFKPRAHEVAGKALLISDGGKTILRFEDFETTNGPQLKIYLSSDLSSNDFIDLGDLKATKGNVNYEVPEGIDLDKYDKVLVWCKPFGVLFSYADLN